MSDTSYMQHSALAKGADAPSLVSMLAKMWIAVLDGDERIRRGADPAEVLAKAQADINRAERAVLDLVRGLRDERDEALRLLRVAARCLRCGTCHALATVATKEPRYPDGPMGGYPLCDACGEPGRHADLPQAADVRRIAELTEHGGDAT